MPFTQSLAFSRRLKKYFYEYGGWKAVAGSPLFLGAVLTTAIGYSYWLTPRWVSISFVMLPNLLGFSLGTYAILFSLVTARMKRALRTAKNANGISRLAEINATFFHFIFVQVVALTHTFLFNGTALVDLANTMKASHPWAVEVLVALTMVGSFCGMLLLVYSLLLILGAALAVYRLASIVDPQEGA